MPSAPEQKFCLFHLRAGGQGAQRGGWGGYPTAPLSPVEVGHFWVPGVSDNLVGWVSGSPPLPLPRAQAIPCADLQGMPVPHHMSVPRICVHCTSWPWGQRLAIRTVWSCRSTSGRPCAPPVVCLCLCCYAVGTSGLLCAILRCGFGLSGAIARHNQSHEGWRGGREATPVWDCLMDVGSAMPCTIRGRQYTPSSQLGMAAWPAVRGGG